MLRLMPSMLLLGWTMTFLRSLLQRPQALQWLLEAVLLLILSARFIQAILLLRQVTVGVRFYGDYGWGLAGSTPIDLLQRDWFLDNFDNDLVANIRRGPIYYWERGSSTAPSTALDTRAVLLSSLSGNDSVPTLAMQVAVSQNDKHLLAFGCQPYAGGSTDFDPLLIRWASQDEPQYWNPTGTTPGGAASSAGFLRVSRGSEIVAALATRQETLVWTDTTLYSLQFTGTTDVFALQQLADNISIISPRAAATANNVTYWMGTDKFYVYSGQIQTLPTTVREYVYKDINYAQADQIVSGTNEGFNEVWWFYPSADSNWNNRYVIYNHLEQVWYYGSVERTAWLDTPLRDFPTALYTAEYEYDRHGCRHTQQRKSLSARGWCKRRRRGYDMFYPVKRL
jgi:hypothetical protein